MRLLIILKSLLLSLRAQKKVTKEMHPCHLSRFAGFPALEKENGRCETRPPAADSNSPRAFSVFFFNARLRVNGESTTTTVLFGLSTIFRDEPKKKAESVKVPPFSHF